MKERFSIHAIVPRTAKKLTLRVKFKHDPGAILLFRTEADEAPLRVERSGLVAFGINQTEAIYIEYVEGGKPEVSVAWFDF